MNKGLCSLCVAIVLFFAFSSLAFAAEPFVYPSGIKQYAAAALIEEFKTNEYAMAAALKDTPVVVVGKIKSVKKESYYEDPEKPFEGKKSKAPTVTFVSGGTIEDFKGFLFDDPVDPALLVAGELAGLLCENLQYGPMQMTFQGKCKVVVAGPYNDNGWGELSYKNEELHQRLSTPKK